MKTLTLPLVVLVAMALVVWLVVRRERGKRLIVRSRFAMRAVRVAAVILLVLNMSPVAIADEPVHDGGREEADVDAHADALPQITPEGINRWRRFQTQYFYGRHVKEQYLLVRYKREEVDDREFLQVVERHQKHAASSDLSALLHEDMSTRFDERQPTPPGVEKLISALKAQAEDGVFDAWFVAYVWKRSRELPPAATPQERIDRRELFAELAQQARIVNAMVLVRAEVKPIAWASDPWMSKGGPRPGQVRRWQEDNQAMHRAFKRLYPTTDVGTWATEGGVMFTLDETMPAITLIRAGEEIEVKPGETFHFQRLDLIETPQADSPVVVHHGWLGAIPLPKDELISVWRLASYISAEQKTIAQDAIDRAAADGDDEAMTQLEKSLPLVWPLLSEAAWRQPDTAAGARLRTLFSLFDDTLAVDSPFR